MAGTCNVGALMGQSACLQGLSEAQLAASKTQLMCGWVNNALPAGPVASYDPSNLGFLSWSWSNPAPSFWLIELSPDGVSAWIQYDVVAGTVGAEGGMQGLGYFRVTALDAGQNPASQPSNVINAT